MSRAARLALVLVGALLAALGLVPVRLGVAGGWALTRVPCQGVATPPSAHGLSAAEEVRFSSTHNLTLRGVFVPGRTPATVIVAPTYGAGRYAHLDVAAQFHAAGLSVLTYEARRCAGRGHTTLGAHEALDVQAAYAYLLTRPDVDAARISAHGFSEAGAAVLMGAARVPGLRATSAMGNYAHFVDTLGIGQADNVVVGLFQRGVALGYWASTGGQRLSALSPLAAMPALAPRPVLLVYGTREASWGAGQQLAAAGGANVTLWAVDGAGHGDYATVDPDGFRARVIGFHVRAHGLDPAS